MNGFKGSSRIAFCALAALMWVGSGCHQENYENRYAEGEIDFPDDLYAASAIGEDHLWVAGYFGAIFRTQDGGETWRKLDTDTDKSIYDISFADENNGWAVGRRGFVIHTTDGGDSWERQTIPREPAQHLFAVHAVSPKIAWAVGDWGGRYYTEDGGKTWQDRSFRVHEDHPVFKYLTEEEMARFEAGDPVYDDMFLNDIFFLDRNNGWIAGEYGFIFRTEDGGVTWEQATIKGDIEFEPVRFPSGENKVPKERWNDIFDAAEILIDKPYLRVRVEGFMTREEYEQTGETALADERAEEIQAFLEGEGVLQDAIKIRNRTPFDLENFDMEGFLAKKLVEEPRATMEVIETPFLFDVKFRNEKEGIVAGLGGVVLATDDGGQNWRYLETESRQAMFGAAFGDGYLVAVGEKGHRKISSDGGETWQLIGGEDGYGTFAEASGEGFYGYMRDVVFGDTRHGWIVGEGALVMRSTDGGKSWYQVLPNRASEPETGAGE